MWPTKPASNLILIVVLLTTVVIGSCGYKQVYSDVQQNTQRECQKLPPSAYDECMEQNSESFESYTQKRADLLK